jgi:5-methylcytosine-specific restriction protein B
MNQEEINSGIKLLCETSAQVKGYYSNDQNIVEALNNAKKEDLQKCMDYYKSKSGVVIDPRKEIIEKLLNREKFTVESLHELINSYKEGKENQFRSYKETFSIVFPAITFYGHNSQRDFVTTFTEKLIDDLEISNEVKVVSFDFQGVRQQGSKRYWVAIYNKHQENQSIGVQFFIEFFEGKIGYGVYKHENQTYLKPRVSLSPEEFDYNDILSYFQESKQTLLDDIPKYDNLQTLDLDNHKLYKISHGSFKAKKTAHVIDTFKSNNWIVLHEDTGKGQADSFKSDLKAGDYVYITVGSKELIGIAKLINNDWDYVPNDIVDSDGWIYREVEIVHPAVRKKPKGLTNKKAFYPSANSTFSEIKPENIREANDNLFKPYFNTEFITASINMDNPDKMINELNQILFGPPGTGKTYNTINKALELCGEDLTGLNRQDIKELYKKRVDEFRIVFTTFHQSMTYEDFIEGIKPKMNGDDEAEVSYEIQEGIFKSICKRAEKESSVNYSSDNFDEAWEKLIDLVKTNLLENKLIKIGSWEYGLSSKDSLKYSSLNTPSKYNFTITKQNVYDAYRNKKARPSGAFQKDMGDVVDFMKTQFNLNDFQENAIVNKVASQNFVLIIDEINRGNVSQIFGELITLIEEDKRLGNPEAIQVQLPYSKDWFGVPPNVYIIGTMNTADRSVEALDTALRRRFSFTEMPPKPDLIKTQGKAAYGIINGIDLSVLLETINERIEKLLDKDHMIGHSYFLLVEDLNGLKSTFQNKIVPLLQEYFFGDYGKIGLVIGSKFFDIKDNQVDEDFFAPFEDYDSSPLVERKVYHLKNIQEISDELFVEALNDLLRKNN